MKIDINNIGNRLKIIRTFVGVKQLKLSQDIDISQQLLSQFETNKRVPPLEFIIKFCDYFQISVGLFFLFVEDFNYFREIFPILNTSKNNKFMKEGELKNENT